MVGETVGKSGHHAFPLLCIYIYVLYIYVYIYICTYLYIIYVLYMYTMGGLGTGDGETPLFFPFPPVISQLWPTPQGWILSALPGTGGMEWYFPSMAPFESAVTASSSGRSRPSPSTEAICSIHPSGVLKRIGPSSPVRKIQDVIPIADSQVT